MMTSKIPAPNAVLSAMVSLLLLGAVQAPAAVVQTGGADSKIGYATLHVIRPGDSEAVAVEKAAKVLPRPNQTAWMRLERIFFIHFGVNTFRGVEWGNGHESPSIFNPTALDANQWIGAVKEAGGREVVLVCKHHDGFCMWPTRYTPHSVAASPWRGGKGDLVGEVAAVAHADGVKLGVYLSPADLYQLCNNPTHPGGYYGDGSPRVASVIPTDPRHFKSDPTVGRTPPSGRSSYTYVVDDYNRYFLNQLYELLTQYGPISEVWFDGANPDPRVKESYDYSAWYDLIRHLQPNAVIAVKGPEVRWVGNEGGVGRRTEWSVIPLDAPPSRFAWPDMHGEDLGGRDKLKPGTYLWWYPAEVNAPILNGWFWSPEKRPKSASQLIDIYYTSVGRNGDMLLNLSPDTRGLIPDDQLASLRGMAQVIADTFATNLAAGGVLSADTSSPSHGPACATDGNLDTWWEAAPGHSKATLELSLPKPVTFDVVSLQEAVDHRGQRIESFAIDAWNGSSWVTFERQTTVGHRRLLRIQKPVTTARVRIRILSSRLEPTLATIGLYRQAVPIPPPVLPARDAMGAVKIACPAGRRIVYTLDGSEPTLNSAVYRHPIDLSQGGTLEAACVTARGQLGLPASRDYVGLAPIGWRLVGAKDAAAALGDHGPANAIDGAPSTFWITAANLPPAEPRAVVVDMGTTHRIRGFAYLPRQDGKTDGVVESYRFEISRDGLHWITVIDHGRFGNIRNNPAMQETTFAPTEARYFKFTGLSSLGGDGRMGAAEITVLSADSGR
ncbi:sialidase precursor [mine drainage metagenome]|uniref:alpha-L-fucosidase n=1 Tax=mine drainage metagenome TaxID=410659 RepID=A0A1J5RIB9_9ZZZZ